MVNRKKDYITVCQLAVGGLVEGLAEERKWEMGAPYPKSARDLPWPPLSAYRRFLSVGMLAQGQEFFPG